jgi:hypothetical protein
MEAIKKAVKSIMDELSKTGELSYGNVHNSIATAVEHRNDTIDKKILRLLNLMFSDEYVRLSKKGSKEVLKCFPETEGERWYILAINANKTLHICSEYHKEIDGMELSDFE